MDAQKKRMGDRFDATLVRNIDPLHWFMPYLYPNRADNEAFVREEFDLTNQHYNPNAPHVIDVEAEEF